MMKIKPRLNPPVLKPGDRVAIVAPARWPNPNWTQALERALRAQGYDVFVHPQTQLKDGQLGGRDAARAGALNDVFRDPSIRAVFCARGGTGCSRLLHLLDYAALEKDPKIICGFSDVTVLLNAIAAETGLVTFHGPMGWNFDNAPDPRTVDGFFDVLSGRKTTYSWAGTVVRAGTADGRLVGGNITLLQSLIGTRWDWTAEDSILFIEDVEEVLYKLDRTLWHFRHAGKLDRVKAVLVGEIVGMVDAESGMPGPNDQPYGRTLAQCLEEVLPPGIPICTDLPLGHGAYLETLPIGQQACLQAYSNGHVDLAISV
jgi:muramoyltetrapeptide carboxypeptidase